MMANCYSSSEEEETIESSSSDDETGELATLHYDESKIQVGWEICIGAPVRNVY